MSKRFTKSFTPFLYCSNKRTVSFMTTHKALFSTANQ
jgi:proline dehydrogenase